MEQINQSLNKLYHQPEWPNAVAVVRELCLTLGLVMVDEPVLISDNDKINENRHRFQSAKRFNRPAVYELELDNPNIEVKLFWATKTLKTNLAWMVGITANFEDGKIFESDSYNLGIDIIIPKECDSITVLVSNNHKIRSLELKEKLSRTDLEILSKLKGLIGKSLTTVEDKKSYHNILWNAFDFEPINRKFYKELVERFGVLRSHLVSGGLDDQDAVMFTTRLIGRLLFVWFLRKKSLINEKVGYFEPQLQGSDTSYYRTKLQKLFFETLNTENDQRKPDDEKITPYLNGGLFDPSRTDFVNDDRLQFPDGYFKDFYTALSHYNFTVDESSPEFEQVAVDPEMLGKIFESLLAEQRTETGAQARKAKGAFYTPREIVSYMCEQSLEQYLLTQLNDSESKDQNLESRIKEIIGMNETTFRDQDHNKRRDWKLIKDAIIAALNNLTVFDPAVGSGAYPMGMLQLLVKVYTRLDSKYENNLSKLKRDILDRSLYGSDIDSTAIEISRLRAWLSLVVDLAADEKVTPLPNLEFHFVCANTLISLPQNKGIFDTDDLKEDLGVIRQNYYNTNSKAKKESLKKSYNQLIDSNSNKLGSVVDEILTTYQPFLHESRASFFDPDLMFGVDKFDIVIGNPPYVGEKGNKETFRPIADSPLGKRFYQGKMDLFYFFFHNALDNLRDGGIMSFVTTNYYITATGGVKLRNDMRERSTVLQLLNFGELKVFESALGQHNMITIIQKGISNTNAKTLVTQRKGYLGKDILSSVIGRTDSQTSYYELTQDELYSGNNIKLTSGGFDQILDKVELNLKLKKYAYIYEGLQTGANEIFIFDELPEFYNKLLKTEKLLFKPFYKNSNIKKYELNEKHKFILYFKNEVNIFEYPNIYNYLLGHKEILENRGQIKRSKQPWHTLLWARNENNFINENIVAPYRSNNVSFTINKGNFYSGTDTYFVTNPKNIITSKLILGILNSRMSSIWFKNRGKVKGSVLEMTGDNIENLPIPKITAQNQPTVTQIENLVDSILTAKSADPETNTTSLERQIDVLVYELYDLTAEEIGIVEGER